MIRSIVYFVQIGMLVGIAAFLLAQRGQFDVTIGPYHIQGDVSFLLVFVFVAGLILLALHRLWVDMLHFPLHWRRYRRDIRLKKGHAALTRALSALAMGDTHGASKEATRARHLLPEFPAIPTILMATTAQKEGRAEESQRALTDLLQTDARDLGVRGLVAAAVSAGHESRALDIAQGALQATPKMKSLSRLVYDLECQNGLFDSALKRQRSLCWNGLLSHDQARADGVVLWTALARASYDQGDHRAALRAAKKAIDIDPAFVPAACLLIDLYRGHGRTRRALWVLHAAYARAPHPDLIERHEQMAPQTNDVRRRMRYHEKLFLLAPQNVDSLIFMARICMTEQLWGEAMAHLESARKISPRRAVYRALSHLAGRQGLETQSRTLLEEGMTAVPDPAWHCRVTGAVYDKWYPVTPSGHLFGTILWGVPEMGQAQKETRESVSLVSGL